MLQFLVASIGFIPWVLYIILTYYSTSFSQINHIESASGFGGYLFGLGIVYAIYKAYSMITSPDQVRLHAGHILGFFLIQLFLVSLAYTATVNEGITKQIIDASFFPKSGASTLDLFFHCVSLLIYPLFLGLLWRAIGYTSLSWIDGWRDRDMRIRIGAEMAIGMGIFVVGLLILGATHMLTLTGLISILVIYSILSYRGWIETYRDLMDRRIVLDQHDTDIGAFEMIRPKLLSIEFGFLLVTFLISVSLINAIRPMPIGWDDLGVYMNYPRIMALTGSYLTGAGLYTWQLITSTGFLWNQIAAQAFYVNQLGGILSMVTIISVLSYLFSFTGKKYLISLPVILGIIYYLMPMTIFQQAKDMKIDPALMSVSVAAFGLLWYTLREQLLSKKTQFILMGVVGCIVGIAFTMKVTTLMLIIGALGLIAYNTLSIGGFLGYFFLFLTVFTGAGLWSKMNVWMPTSDVDLIQKITLGCLAISIVSFAMSIRHSGIESLKKYLSLSLIFLVGLIVGILPWAVKNGLEAGVFGGEKRSGLVDGVLGGYGGTLILDNYSAIYTPAEYTAKRTAQQAASITSDGKSLNEDFSRYFGQESGLNNYLKLPANLTFQKNQTGEFTEITYIFLALFPAILLFVRGRRSDNPLIPWVYTGTIGFGLLGMCLYYFTSFGSVLTTVFGTYALPLGYLILLLIPLGLIVLTHFFVDTDELGDRIKSLMIILVTYGFLFLISAFGIVWYGVLVYFLLVAIIGLAALNFVMYDDTEDDNTLSAKITLTGLLVIFIATYFVRSAFPHGWNNLISSGMNEYKYHRLDQNESIFTYRSDYVTPIATMNLKNPELAVKKALSLATSPEMKKILTDERVNNMTPVQLHQILLYFMVQLRGATSATLPNAQAIAADVKKMGASLYNDILAPTGDNVNTGGIYRIGTFMTYLINDNRKRYLDDSLVFEFDTFFYDPKPEVTIERMKKMGLKYLLIDLNAATIDRDARHALTTRYEHLLLSTRATNLRLIDTDNTCLKLALDEYRTGKLKEDQKFLDIAGTNYESYSGSRQIIRNVKQNNCANYMIDMMNTAGSGTTLPSYIAQIRASLMSAKDQTEQQQIIGRAVGQSYFALFEIQ